MPGSTGGIHYPYNNRKAGGRTFAVLVFRGTSGRLSNWLVNLDMALCPWPSGGNVHRGFKTVLVELWDTIATALNTVKKPLFFTGHSLGGTLAQAPSFLFGHAPSNYTAQLPVAFDNLHPS